MSRRGPALIALVAVFVIAGVVPAVAAPLTDSQTLGKAVFFDEDLSLNRNQSCASCHDPAVGWTGPDSALNAAGAVYEGSIPGAFGNRKPPSSAYATVSPIFHLEKGGLFVGGNFWDGRATGEKLGNPAADQAQGPFLNPAEQALPYAACVVYRVATAVTPADYPVSFAQVWGWDPATDVAWPANMDDVCSGVEPLVLLPDDMARVDLAYDQIALSIAAYEGSPESNAFTSKFDAVMTGAAKFTARERSGFNLFNGKGKCSKCHTSKTNKGQPVLFTDFTFDNLGVPKNPLNPMGTDFVDYGLGAFLATRLDYSLYEAANNGKHKVPTLRNVDLRPYPAFVKAYGHNGYFKSLEEIVHFYNTRDVPGAGWNGAPWPPPEVAANVNTAELGNLKLSPSQERDIVAFLKTLSDGWTPTP